MAALGSGPAGLSSEKAIAKLRAVSTNTVRNHPHLSAFRLFLRQFESPLVLILIFAAAISLVLQQSINRPSFWRSCSEAPCSGFFQVRRPQRLRN